MNEWRVRKLRATGRWVVEQHRRFLVAEVLHEDHVHRVFETRWCRRVSFPRGMHWAAVRRADDLARDQARMEMDTLEVYANRGHA